MVNESFTFVNRNGKSLSAQGIRACWLNQRLTCLNQNLSNKKACQAFELAGLFQKWRRSLARVKTGFSAVFVTLQPDCAPDRNGQEDRQKVKIEDLDSSHGSSFRNTCIAAKCRTKAVDSQVIVERARPSGHAKGRLPPAADTRGAMNPAATQAVDNRSTEAAVSLARSF